MARSSFRSRSGRRSNSIRTRGTGFCISKFMILELVAAVILLAACSSAWHNAMRKGDIVRGGVVEHARGDSRVSPRLRCSSRPSAPTMPTASCRCCGRCSSLSCACNCWVWFPGPVRRRRLWRHVRFGRRHFSDGADLRHDRRFGPSAFWINCVPHMDLPLVSSASDSGR